MTRYYDGPCPSSKKTALSAIAVPAPSIRDLFRYQISSNSKPVILDYGAGNGRNAEWLRHNGFSVYAYDPFNYNDLCGWSGISMFKPDGVQFDVVFTSYVLNVVTKRVGDEIVIDAEKYCKPSGNVFHVVRNDLEQVASVGLIAKSGIIYDFFIDEFGGTEDQVLFPTTWTELSLFGFKTQKGFQRLVSFAGDDRYDLIINTRQYKVYRRAVR